MKVSKLDTLLAIKAICLVPGLNNNDRRVGAALIDHYNRQTGQCDPGIQRLTKLLNVHRRTVIRSINALESAGCFLKERHGGQNNRNSYKPNWQRLSEFDASWNAKMKSSGRKQMPDASPAERQSRHLCGDTDDTQTLTNNLSTKTYSKSYRKEEARATCAPSTSSIRRQLTPSARSAFGTRSAVAARNQAERRWHDDLLTHFRSMPDAYSAFVAAIDSVLQTAATAAELKERGAGLRHILEQVKLGEAT
jgi:hypothetical protein